MLAHDVLDDLLLPGDVCLAAPSEPMKDRQTSSRFQPRRSSTFIRPLLINDEIETPLDFFLVAKESAVSLASETQVTDG
jgi:hypothetical protein